MELSLRYGSRVAAIPADGLEEYLKSASRVDLAVLLSVATAPALSPVQRSEALGASPEEVLASLRMWEEKGLLSVHLAEGESLFPDKADAAEDKPKKLQAADLPSYSTEETARILENSADIAFLLDACQQILGKMFSTAEINILVGMVDFLALDGDYIMLLCQHCVDDGKRTMRYVEKTALALVDQGVTRYKDLEIYFRDADSLKSTEGKVRSLFGLGSRSFTKKEKEYMKNWTDWGYGPEVIEKAFEATVSGTGGKASLPYANRILQRWHEEGLDTLEAILAGGTRPTAQTADQSTFDTDDFFAAALRRSYGEEKLPAADT